LFGFVDPGGEVKFFHFEGVFEKGEEEAERGKKQIKNDQDDFGLENADFVGNSFPALPK